MSNYNQLKDVLNDIFELNKADLDFGIYRIINQKRKQVNEFIDKQLPTDIKTALSATQTADKAELENELKTLKKNLDDAGVVADETPKYKQLKEKLALLDNSDVLEQEVFSHLANFFRRYYKDGDFISMRRYKKDVYAIPYEGEEVKLHWANHDQYYIKSSENFKNYSFLLGDNSKVTFQLKEVSTEQNNNKTQGDAERRFAIYEELPVEVLDGELFINFVYEPFPKATKQDVLLATAISVLTENVPSEFAGVFALSPTEKNPRRTLLDKHLNDYVSKNSFDYFIHKDLGGFLSRELDFYIKNEVLYLDDINVKQTDFFVAQLSKVKAIKTVATKVIDFLAQIENFQKKLWLKKKFVLRTDYCITLDRIPETYYPEIFANKDQLAEWKMLFDVELQNDSQLAFEQFLVLDTKFFEEQFKDRLLAEFDDLEEQTNGLLINSENFQALGLMKEKLDGKIDVNYIDPPYNTSEESFLYKNDYKHSSWYSLLFDRLQISKSYLNSSGILCCAIDDLEFSGLQQVLDLVYLKSNRLGNLVIEIKPSGRTNDKYLATSHEYVLVYAAEYDNAEIAFFPLTVEQLSQYKEGEGKGSYKWRDFLRTGGFSTPIERPNSYYPIYYSPETGNVSLTEIDNSIEILPIDSVGKSRVWRKTKPSFLEHLEKGEINFKQNKDGQWKVQIIDNVKDGMRPKSVWVNSKYDASSHGTKLLKSIFGDMMTFSFPKSIHAVYDTLYINSINNEDSLIFDYFAGSGTTGHATIKLNREDNGNRKYILVEMGTYFNTVTKPRIQKVIYSDNWKNGKPQDKVGISQIVKYQVLESYEDTLNNLLLNELQNQSQLDFSERASEEYLLHYMLEMESREHLFNLEMFRKPFDYQLKVTENNELKPTKVDLVETFNYLIGLYASKVQRVKDIKVVEGVTRTGIKTLVIWRDMETTTHDDVVKLVRRFYDSARTREFQQIYINGDHHLENLRADGDQFKIKMIEETFFKKMFNESEL
ncbi:MAG: DNA methyltransferase [Bacteroidales bacterium]